ncbi:MAG: hypothetical protein LC658_10130, partial [Bacteroidales bacterium]|nr:hypothetical protein [Bacteroidales bacterium]
MRHLHLLFIFAMATKLTFAQSEDPYFWLEEVENPKALEWVETWNEKSLNVLSSQPDYENLYEKNLEILNSTDRIAEPAIRGEFVYNFWQDQQYQRGIWRRAKQKNYLSGNPDWEILLNIDELSEKDGEKWVFKGASGLYPEYNKFLVSLSKGGGDAVIIREFDVRSKSFVENGFYLPEAKGGASWIDENTLMVSTDFGQGVTTSGYPTQVKIWERGTKLENAREVYKGLETDMGIWGYAQQNPEKVYQLITRYTSFYSGDYFFIENGKTIKLDVPDDIELNTIFKGQVIFQLKSEWNINGQNFPQGAVISISYSDLLDGKKNYELVVQPDERSSITEISNTKDRLLVNMLVNVKSELFSYRFENVWKKEKI